MAKQIKKTPAQQKKVSTGKSETVNSTDEPFENFPIQQFHEKIRTAIREFSSVSYSGEGRISSGSSGFGKLNLIGNLIRDIIPSDKQACIKKAYSFVESDDFLMPLVEMLVDFSTAGFHLQPEPIEQSKDAYKDIGKHNKLIKNFKRNLDINQVNDQLFRDYFISDSCILYWKLKGDRTRASKSESELLPQLIDINALSPGLVDWCNTGGQDIMRVIIHDAARKRIEEEIENLKKARITNRQQVIDSLRKSGTGFKWIEAVLDRKDYVILDRKDNDYWIVQTKERKYHGLAYPSMKNIFTKLTIRSFHQEGELSAAFLFAFFIMMIKQGESITSGPQSGSKINWIKAEDAKSLQEKFNKYSKALRMVMNHTTSVEWIFPPPEMFDPERLEGCNSAILNWAGFTKSLFGGDGGTYSGGYLGLRKATAKMNKSRSVIAMLWSKFFNDSSIANQTKILKRINIEPVFDENILKEPKQLLEEVKFLFDSSISDQRTSARELGRDPELLKVSTLQSREEEETLLVWTGVAKQGESKSTNKGGRPITEAGESDEFTRNQAPSPRQTENSSLSKKLKKVSTGKKKS